VAALTSYRTKEILLSESGRFNTLAANLVPGSAINVPWPTATGQERVALPQRSCRRSSGASPAHPELEPRLPDVLLPLSHDESSLVMHFPSG